MAAVPQHLRVINSPYRQDGPSPLFHLFPRLPTELRLRIWECSLHYHRLLDIWLEAPDSVKAQVTPVYSTRNSLGRLVSGRECTVATVPGFQLHSKLLRVSHEARTVALQFYRVHVPIRIHREGDYVKNGTLYFNPEFDILYFRLGWNTGHSFVDFLHDLKSHDPHGVGLLHLALGSPAMRLLNLMTDIPKPIAMRSFTDSVSRLRTITWMAESDEGRAIMGVLSDFPTLGVRFNHALPIKAANNPRFDLLARDPRPIGPELKFVLTACTDPRESRVLWRELLARWGIRLARPIKERVLFAYEPSTYEQEVCDMETAESFLREEEDGWMGSQLRWGSYVRSTAGRMPVESPAELVNATRPAIGFWLFPAEALGDLNGNNWRSKVVYDMTDHWPELALSHLR